MNDDNPYKSPEADLAEIAAPPETMLDVDTTRVGPTVSPTNTIISRHLAASLDTGLAMCLALAIPMTVSEDMPFVQLGLLLGSYLGYFFLFEGLISRTPGKLLCGLVVVQFDGSRCNWRQSAIRTCFRVLEVNPIFLGAIPAALCIVFSRNRQRLGDRVARTIVVHSRLLPRRR